MGAGEATGPWWGGEGKGGGVARGREVLIAHSLGMLQCSPGCCHPGRRAQGERTGGAVGSVAEPSTPWGSFRQGTPAATLWGTPYLQSCKNTTACTMLPPSPETSRVPEASSSPRFVSRGGRGVSPQGHQLWKGCRSTSACTGPRWCCSSHRTGCGCLRWLRWCLATCKSQAELLTGGCFGWLLGQEMEPSLLRSGRAPGASWDCP